MTAKNRLIRNSSLVTYSIKEKVFVLDPTTGDRQLLPEINPTQLHAVLSLAEQPISREDLLSSISVEKDSYPAARDEIVDILLREGLLREEMGISVAGALLEGIEQQSYEVNIVLGITGAVSASMTPSAVFNLRKNLTENIEIILTDAATNFVTATSLQALSGKPVWQGIFDHPEITTSPHIYLADCADLIVIYPCSAHTLFKLAMGSCDDLLSLTVCASKAPLVLVPAMNNTMWCNTSVQKNLSILRDQGAIIIEPQRGIEVGTKIAGQIAKTGGQGVFDSTIAQTLLSILETLESAD